MMPSQAIIAQSRRARGSLRPRTKTIPHKIEAASRKRSAANVNGGQSSNPSLMNIQVEPQIRHSSSQTARYFLMQKIQWQKIRWQKIQGMKRGNVHFFESRYNPIKQQPMPAALRAEMDSLNASKPIGISSNATAMLQTTDAELIFHPAR